MTIYKVINEITGATRTFSDLSARATSKYNSSIMGLYAFSKFRRMIKNNETIRYENNITLEII